MQQGRASKTDQAQEELTKERMVIIDPRRQAQAKIFKLMVNSRVRKT